MIRPEGTYFPYNDRRSVHYPTYYTATWQHEKKITQYVFLQFICYRSGVHSVIQQRNSSPNRCRFASPSSLLSSSSFLDL